MRAAVADDRGSCGRTGGQVVVQYDTAHKLIYCFIPLLVAQLLLCAAAALLADMPAAGLLLGHVLTAGMCLVFLREDSGSGCRTAALHGFSGKYLKSQEYMRCMKRAEVPSGKSSVEASGHITVMETAVWTVAACALCLISTYLLNITGIADADGTYMSADAVIEGAPAVLRCVLVIIAAPISEEMLYRGVLYQRVTGCFGPCAGFSASVAAFALSHGNLTQGIAACAGGVLMTAARIRCGEIGESCVESSECSEGSEQEEDRGYMGYLWLPILVHAAFNACSAYVVPML